MGTTESVVEMIITQVFKVLLLKYTDDKSYVDLLWNELKTKYSEKKRYYHNLTHIENLYHELFPLKNQFQDWDITMFALFYHDVIYKVSRKDNEEKSAELAIQRISKLEISKDRIEKCQQQIIATKSHELHNDNDINLFTDADLSILGKEWNIYDTYRKQIRNEYKVYPSFLYNPGRMKVLNHFLSMPRIFKTDYFFDKYEKQTRENLKQELNEYNN